MSIKPITNKRFVLAAVMLISGVAMLFVALFIPPVGQISGSVLGAAGEIFVTGGAILGIGEAALEAVKKIASAADDAEKKVSKK